MNRLNAITILLTTALFVTSCGSTQNKRTTLREIDIIGKRQSQSGVFIKPKSDAEIRSAYAEYLKHATKDDASRIDAINRLAELEFEYTEKLIKDKEKTGPATPANSTNNTYDELYYARLDRTIELLSTSIKDYPDAKGNDKTMYQLAKAYEQRGKDDESLKVLRVLVKKYPKSRYYVESLFRLGEDAFSARNYRLAEDTYTSVITAPKNNIFYEKSLFKRGWSRFKQEFYLEAVDDFLEVVNFNNYGDYAKLSKNEREEFDEYFRAIGLSFSYMGGAEPLNEYIKENPGFPYTYFTYAHVSDIYAKQQRYSDAVETLNYFIKSRPKSKYVPEAHLKILAAWQKGGFAAKMNIAAETFYNQYHPDNKYWLEKQANHELFNNIKQEMKSYILTVAANYHKEYQTGKKEAAFINAKKWYERYLMHYAAQSRKDNVHLLYAGLLAQHGNRISALKHYELAAYDGELILNKEAAYETILICSQLGKGKNGHEWLDKLLKYSGLYSQLYPNDKHTANIIAHAADSAYKNKKYAEAIRLTEFIPDKIRPTLLLNINTIRAHSFFNLKQYPAAENAYTSMLRHDNIPAGHRKQFLNNIALSIYQQGAEIKQENPKQAIAHYVRISNIAPSSSIAATGLYDAIALAMQSKMWAEAIAFIKRFQSLYPRHKYSHDVTRKLSVAYLNSDQNDKAAAELIKVSEFETSTEVQVAALWKASELYEKQKNFPAAISSYQQYVKKFPNPFPQNLEAMHRLTDLYNQQNDRRNTNSWRWKIINADKKAPASLKTDRTKYIASNAALQLAKINHNEFNNIRLLLPLKRSLQKKKQAMQRAVNLYGRASSYGVSETATEATHAIAEIYRTFSKSLLESERPKHLSKTELEQYDILLEDQAFPFEEKAIEFFETNLKHATQGINDKWIKFSHNRLREIYPVRYNRKLKLDSYVNTIH